jgi:hypothetical protein
MIFLCGMINPMSTRYPPETRQVRVRIRISIHDYMYRYEFLSSTSLTDNYSTPPESDLLSSLFFSFRALFSWVPVPWASVGPDVWIGSTRAWDWDTVRSLIDPSKRQPSPSYTIFFLWFSSALYTATTRFCEISLSLTAVAHAIQTA